MKKIALLIIALLLAGLLAWWLLLRPAVDARSPLAFVPADTPYVFALAEPMPEAVLDYYRPHLPMLRDLYAQQVLDLHDMLAASEHAAPVTERVLLALHEELAALDPETLAALMRSRSAIYGIGLLPVLRIEVEDPAAVAAFVARLETAAGEPLPQAEIDGQAYWLIGAEEWPLRLVLALIEGHLVASALPTAAEPEVVRTVLGLAPPSRSLAESGELRELQQRLGYLPQMAGYLHTQRLIDAITGPASAVDRAFLALAGIEKPTLDGSCRDEYAALAGAWPRLSLGYTRLDARHQDARFVIEARSDIAQELMKLRAPMPGLSSARDSLASFGFSLRLANLPQVTNTLTANASRNPWTCPSLLALNEVVAKSREQMTSPALFMAAPVFQGAHFALTRLDLAGFDFSAAEPFADGLPEFGAVAVIGTDNPASLLAMAQSALPAGARLPLQTDGVARPLPRMPNVPFDMPMHVAMNEKAIAVSIGAGEQDLLAAALRSDPAVQPLYVGSIDGRLYTMFADAMIALLDSDQSEMARAMAGNQDLARVRRDMEVVREVYARLIHRIGFSLELTERGIELLLDTELP